MVPEKVLQAPAELDNFRQASKDVDVVKAGQGLLAGTELRLRRSSEGVSCDVSSLHKFGEQGQQPGLEQAEGIITLHWRSTLQARTQADPSLALTASLRPRAVSKVTAHAGHVLTRSAARTMITSVLPERAGIQFVF